MLETSASILRIRQTAASNITMQNCRIRRVRKAEGALPAKRRPISDSIFGSAKQFKRGKDLSAFSGRRTIMVVVEVRAPLVLQFWSVMAVKIFLINLGAHFVRSLDWHVLGSRCWP